MHSGSVVRRGGLAALWLALAALGACTTRQSVPLECVPEQVQVYVDGRLLEEGRRSVELPVDAPHKLYFKREGHEPQLVVLEPSEAADGSLRLEPADVCVELVPMGIGRELTIEADEEAGAR